jgi:hypothetical protein
MNDMIEHQTVKDAKFAELNATLAETKAETEELARTAGGSIADVAADWLAAQYLHSLRRHLATLPEGPERVKLLRQATGDVTALQRASHSAARLKLERERVELEQQKHRDALAAAQQAVQKLRDPKLPLRDEDRLAIVAKMDEIFGISSNDHPKPQA